MFAGARGAISLVVWCRISAADSSLSLASSCYGSHPPLLFIRFHLLVRLAEYIEQVKLASGCECKPMLYPKSTTITILFQYGYVDLCVLHK